MSLREVQRTTADDVALREVERRQRSRFRLPAIGLLQSLKVTLKAMLSRAVTVHYPEERIELPPRSRGVIALLEENCTVCMLCSKECPCWCIYIEGHKEQKPGRRKPVNALDRFAIDYGLCMYCGICVEVCPFDALHWSPYFEYTSYTYEGMVHEMDVLSNWEHYVLPPPELVEDADEKAHQQTEQTREKRSQGVWAVIREEDKREAYLQKMAGTAPPSGAMSPVPTHAAPTAPAAEPDAFARPSSDTAPAEAPPGSEVQAPGSPVPAAPDAPAPESPQPTASATTAAQQAREPAADTGGLPRIDPMNLPDGIGPVERGRLKKLAVLQERGQAPPADLIEKLRHVLDQMREAG